MEGRGGVVQGKHQSYTLSAASEDERDSWIHAIRSEPPWRCTSPREQIQNRSDSLKRKFITTVKAFKEFITEEKTVSEDICWLAC